MESEWLPVKAAVKVAGYNVFSLRKIMHAGRVPYRKGPRVGRGPGRATIQYVHMPSLLAYKADMAQHGQHQARPSVMKPSETKLGTALQAWRVARGWSQPDAGKAIGTSKDRISAWERGHSVPSIRMVVKLCELYDLNLQERWSVIEAIAWKQEHDA